MKDPTAIKEYLEQKYHNNDSNKISYEAAIRALIVRYARPTIRIFMEVPHGLNDRSNKIQAHWKDIEILKLFSEKINSSIFDSLNLIKPTKIIANVASATSNLDDFINAVEATAEVVDSSINLIAKSKSPIQTGSESRNKEELIEELNQDIESISHLLKNPIFEAAGVLQYCLQEVERVKEFIEKEIQGSELVKIIYQEFDKNNIPILQALNQEYETKHRSSTEIAQLYTSIWE